MLAGAPSAAATWHGSLKGRKLVFVRLPGGVHLAIQPVRELLFCPSQVELVSNPRKTIVGMQHRDVGRSVSPKKTGTSFEVPAETQLRMEGGRSHSPNSYRFRLKSDGDLRNARLISCSNSITRFPAAMTSSIVPPQNARDHQLSIPAFALDHWSSSLWMEFSRAFL